MKTVSILITFLFALICVVMAGNTVKRQMTYSLANGAWTFSSVAATAGKDGTKSKITCDVRADEVVGVGVNAPLRMRLKYYSDNGDSKSKLNMHASLIELVEFQGAMLPDSTEPAINPSTDPIVHRTTFDRTGWTFSKADTILDKSTTSYWFSVADSNKVLNVTFHWSDDDYYYNGALYGPETIKMDIEIANYNYNHGDNTYLCLHARVQSMSKIGYSKGTNAATIISNNLGMAFGWEPSVTINGMPSSVITTGYIDGNADTDDNEYEVGEFAKHTFYCFPVLQPTRIMWDPTLATFAGASSLVISFVSVVLGIALAILL